MSSDMIHLHINLTDSNFLILLRGSAKYKERSAQTHDSVHFPLSTIRPSEQIWCLLLGDSMLERLLTTGSHTTLGNGRFPHIFNAGVGGDRIQNVLYRLETKGLFHELKIRGVKHAVLQMGTNDLKPKRGLSSDALRQYALVLEAMHRASPKVKVLVTGLMPRKDVAQGFIDHSNAGLQHLVQDYNALMDGTSG
jgi:hypothetical protein